MMFGEEVSGRYLTKWPTYFKPRILADCKILTSNEHIEELMCAQQNSDGTGLDSDLPSILLLVHLLPPTSKGHKKSAKISSYQAVDHVVRYLQIEISVETFLAGVKSGQPFLLSVGEQRNNIQRSSLITSPSLAKHKHPWQLLMSSSKHTSSSVSTTTNLSTTFTHSSKPQCSTSTLEVPKQIPESGSSELEVINILGCKYVDLLYV
ncbi:uncharacterized protein LOC131343676 [Hemibagrus wyckioides]|uniref:uncharacterized protein LOC131343676 n=1 Tax=Hemibagrus wyckioides TaxID=337641 RepID=UPI00266D56B6|nr:uncharacterized protein LOC131343676 [Hemibagrus wyckioides]